MLRLLAWLITGFWPSRSSLRALRSDIDKLEQRVTTLTKKHNSLAGSYYAEFEEPADLLTGAPSSVHAPDHGRSGPKDGGPPGDFPEEQFLELVRERDARARAGGVSHG